jgi:hypothetical protein
MRFTKSTDSDDFDSSIEIPRSFASNGALTKVTGSWITAEKAPFNPESVRARVSCSAMPPWYSKRNASIPLPVRATAIRPSRSASCR